MNRMHKFLIIALSVGMILMQGMLLAQCESCDSGAVCCAGCVSHSFFKPRSVTYNSVYELALNNYQIHHRDPCSDDHPLLSMYMSFFYQRSTNSDDIARYFFPNKQKEITIREDGSGDIGSLWFELLSSPGDFSSDFTMKPRRTARGVYFNFHLDLYRIICGAWMNVCFAPMHVEHELRITENVMSTTGIVPGIVDFTEALNNKTWNFGKFSTEKLDETRVDDVQMKVGYDIFYSDCDGHFGLYAVACFPTGHGSRAKYIFEPMVGNNHFALGAGFNLDYSFSELCSHNVHLLADFKWSYAFCANEMRSFDLCENGSWSRYLLVVDEENKSAIMPGINTFTQRVAVSPRNSINLWAAVHYNLCCNNIELGYCFWWRQKEKISLACAFPRTKGIYDMVGDCNGDPESASTANISQTLDPASSNRPESDAEFTPINGLGLELDSGGVPKARSHTFYAAASYNCCWICTSSMLGLGVSYEYPVCRGALENWSVWVTLGISF